MNLTRSDDNIEFYYDIDNLFDFIIVDTLLISQNIFDRNGKSMMNVYQLDRNNRNIFNHLLKRAASEIFEILSPLSKEVDNAYQYNEGDLESTSTVSEANCIVYVITPHDDWITNMQIPLDHAIEEGLISRVKISWWERRRLDDEKIKEEINFKNIKSKITGLMYYNDQSTIQYTQI